MKMKFNDIILTHNVKFSSQTRLRHELWETY